MQGLWFLAVHLLILNIAFKAKIWFVNGQIAACNFVRLTQAKLFLKIAQYTQCTPGLEQNLHYKLGH